MVKRIYRVGELTASESALNNQSGDNSPTPPAVSGSKGRIGTTKFEPVKFRDETLGKSKEELKRLGKVSLGTDSGFEEKSGNNSNSGSIVNPILLSQDQVIKSVKSKLTSAGFSEAAAREFSNAVPEWLYGAPDSLKAGAKWHAVLVDMIALPAIEARRIERTQTAEATPSTQATGELATEGYNAHKNELESASAFLKVAYEGRLGTDGDLDQSTLRKLDGALLDALNLEFRGEARRKELRAILPTKSDRLDQRLERELGYVPQGEERKRVLTSLSRGHRVGVRTLKPT